MENNVILCSHCRTENPSNSSYCSACGRLLSKKILVKECPRCGTIFDKSDKHCGLCGEILLYGEISSSVADYAEENIGNSREDSVICKHCGSNNFDGFKFCSNCGMSLIGSKKRFCSICKTESSGIYNVCLNCGASLIVKPKAPQVIAKKKFKVNENVKVINKAFLLLLATLLFVFSFLPIFSMKINLLDSVEVKYKFNAYQSATFAFNNIQNQSDKALEKTRLYHDTKAYKKEFLKILDVFDEKKFDFSMFEDKEFSQFLVKEYKLTLRSENTPVSATVLLISFASLIFIITSALAFIFALISFLSSFMELNDLSSACIVSILIAPFSAAIISVALSFTMTYGILNNFSTSWIDIKTLSPALILSIIPAVLLSLFRLFQTAIFYKKTFSLSATILNIWILVCSVLVLIASTSSVLNINITTSLKDSDAETQISIPMSAEFYEIFDNNYIDDIASDTIDTVLEAYKLYTLLDVKNGETNDIAKTIFASALSLSNKTNFAAFSAAKAFILLSAIFSAFTGALALNSLSISKKSSFDLSVASFGTLFTAFFALIFNASGISTINKIIDGVYLSNILSVEAGNGIIALFTLSLITFIISCIASIAHYISKIKVFVEVPQNRFNF